MNETSSCLNECKCHLSQENNYVVCEKEKLKDDDSVANLTGNINIIEDYLENGEQFKHDLNFGNKEKEKEKEKEREREKSKEKEKGKEKIEKIEKIEKHEKKEEISDIDNDKNRIVDRKCKLKVNQCMPVSASQSDQVSTPVSLPRGECWPPVARAAATGAAKNGVVATNNHVSSNRKNDASNYTKNDSSETNNSNVIATATRIETDNNNGNNSYDMKISKTDGYSQPTCGGWSLNGIGDFVANLSNAMQSVCQGPLYYTCSPQRLISMITSSEESDTDDENSHCAKILDTDENNGNNGNRNNSNDVATLESLPSAVLIYILSFMNLFDFYEMLNISKLIYTKCISENNYKYGMAKQQVYNIMKEILTLPIAIDPESRNELIRLYNYGKCINAIHHKHHYLIDMLHSTNSFFETFINISIILQEFEKLCNDLKTRIIPTVNETLTLFIDKYPSSKEMLNKVVNKLNEMLKMNNMYYIILSLIMLLYGLKQDYNSKSDWCFSFIMRTINENYEYLALFRYIFYKCDENIDMLYKMKNVLTINDKPTIDENSNYTEYMDQLKNSKSNEIQKCLAKNYYEALPFSTIKDDSPKCRIPQKFATELVFFTLFGSKHCRERLDLNITKRKFNGFGPLNIYFENEKSDSLPSDIELKNSHILYFSEM